MMQSSDFHAQIDSDLSVEKKFSLFHDFAQNWGFTDVFYARRAFTREEPQKRIIFKRWNPVWEDIYKTKRYDQQDWALKSARMRDKAFTFRDSAVDLSKQQAAFMKDAEHYGRLNGFAMPIKGLGKTVAGFSATGSDGKPMAEQINQVKAAGFLLDNTLAAEIKALTLEDIGIKYREIKLIRMLGQGFSMVQMAAVSGRSEQWIRKSFMGIRETFGVGSNSEVLVQAMRLGLLD